MNTNRIITNRFSNPKSERRYREHWPDEPSTYTELYEQGKLCGGCSFFAPFNYDWGLCCRAESRHHLETVFEHFTCPQYIHEGWGTHSFVDADKYPEMRWMITHYELPESIYDEVRRQAAAINADPDEVDSGMYRLVMAALKDAFGRKSE